MPQAARKYAEPSDLTNNERIVLRHLVKAKDDPLISRDFAIVATSNSGKGEWALPILRRLSLFGLAEQTPLRIGNTSTWRITETGRSAAAVARPAPPELSDDAKALMLGIFMNPKSQLRLENEVRTLSSRARDALRELHFIGLAQVTKEGKIETWSLTEEGRDVDRRQLAPNLMEFMESKGNFSITVKIEEEDQPPSPACY